MNKKLISCVLLGLLSITLNSCGKKVEPTLESINNTETIKSAPLAPKNEPVKRIDVKSTDKGADLSSRELTDEQQREEAEKAMIDYFKNQMGEEAFNKSYRGKMFNKDPKLTLDIDDHDPETAKQMRKDLAFREQNGYLPLDQKDMDDFRNTEKELFSHGDPSESASFELSKLPEDLEQAYTGYTKEGIHPDASSNTKAPVIRRAFHYGGATVLLQEEGSKNGSSHFTKEFVNENIGGYPAVFNSYRSKDNSKRQLIPPFHLK
jgi:transcriptional regulator of met regulon